MKAKFMFRDSERSLIEFRKIYEKYYKEDGWLFNEIDEEIYIIIDKEINLKEAERVDMSGLKLISWKCVNIFEELIEYIIVEE